MKSFVGLLHTDGSAPDARLLERLARRIRLDSSSEPAFAIDAHCGLAVVTHGGGANEGVSRDGSAWLAGELRLDEPEEPLRAWRQWGSDCGAHVWGDFAFAIWDGAARTLFCARDRFGVWPFFHARVPRGLVFSDSLEAVLAHPEVSLDLDRAAVDDYLAGGTPCDPAATIYAAVRRLPPAHALTVRVGEEPSIRAYWTLAPRVRDVARDAPERLADALQRAIASRIAGSSAVVFMSGGLDSTALAALAREASPRTALLAMTSVYRTRVADVEEPFAAEAARSIGIPHRVFPLDGYSPLDSIEKRLWTPEPGPLLTLSMTRDVHALAAAHAPVAMHGHPADVFFAANPGTHLRGLLRRGRVAHFLSSVGRYTMIRRRPPWFLLRRPSARRDRVAEALLSPIWASYFEWAHPLQTGAPVRLVYPWLDPRVVETALALEPVPWLVDKHVIRTILRGRVSETVRRRPKTCVPDDPWRIALADAGDVTIVAAADYVDARRFAETIRRDGALSDATLRTVAFEYWLRELSARMGALRGGAESADG